jgi:serine protease Do
MPAVLSRRAAVALAASATAVGWTDAADARIGPESFAPLIKQVLPTVVNIAVVESVAQDGDPLSLFPPEIRRQFRNRFPQRRREVHGAGSGFIIDPGGLIVTDAHVIGHAERIVVALLDGKQLPAKVVGQDELTDIAVIRVTADSPLPSASWGDSRKLEVGDWVIAAGNPFGLGGSVTAGIVSARGRDIGSGPFDDFIQIDAPINPGNSGGPLFDADGAVVGINSAIYSPTGSSVGIGFAIPSELAIGIVDELRRNGRIERGWLGVTMQETNERGVAIAEVVGTGPAGRAGVRPGDVVMAVNGQPIDDARSLLRAIASITPGQTASLTLRRGGREIDLTVTIGRRPNSEG